MALFITFEGGEGSGKSFQARALYRRLCRVAIPARLTHEPGGTPLGTKIERWLKWGELKGISPLTELMLFNASRAQLVREVILPGLKNGLVVICDRYADSTTAYQGYGRGLALEIVLAVNEVATQGLKPDLVVLLDIPVADGLARKKARRPDPFEQEGITFHQRVREGYLKLAAGEPGRWLVVDTRQPRERVGEVIWRRVSRLLSRQGG